MHMCPLLNAIIYNIQLHSLDLHNLNPRGTKCIHIRILCHICVIINYCIRHMPYLSLLPVTCFVNGYTVVHFMFTIIIFIDIHNRALFAAITCFLFVEIMQFIEDPFSYLQFRHKPSDLSSQNFHLSHTYKIINNSNSDAIIT